MEDFKLNSRLVELKTKMQGQSHSDEVQGCSDENFKFKDRLSKKGQTTSIRAI